jgi:hypothetical protein
MPCNTHQIVVKPSPSHLHSRHHFFFSMRKMAMLRQQAPSERDQMINTLEAGGSATNLQYEVGAASWYIGMRS